MMASSPRADLQSGEAERVAKNSSGRKWSGFGRFSQSHVTGARNSLLRCRAEIYVTQPTLILNSTLGVRRSETPAGNYILGQSGTQEGA